MIGGLGGFGGPWAPVHRFCEEAEIPCLFPTTDVPVTSPPGDYSFYLSAGPEGEAGCLARYLQDGPDAGAPVVQVYREAGAGDGAGSDAGTGADGGAGRADGGAGAVADGGAAAWTGVAAEALRRELGEAVAVEDQPLPAEGALSPDLWGRLATVSWAGPTAGGGVHPEPLPVVVLWLSGADLQALDLAAAPAGRFQRIYLSYRLAGDPPRALPDAVRERLLLTYPYALPGHLPDGIYRVRSWLRARGVTPGDERLQLDTYFALSVADHALAHLVERFDRAYFVERVEHEVETALNPGVYPRLSLGPGQRLAAKGCYLVRPTADDGVEAISSWIVP